jgi:hypothetical protein
MNLQTSLPKIVEKDLHFLSFITNVLTNGQPNLATEDSDLKKNINSIMDNNHEYIVKKNNTNSQALYYITNYGKIFLKIDSSKDCDTYYKYYDLKIYDITQETINSLINIFTIILSHNENY